MASTRARSERGETLIEVLVSIVLLGTVMVTVLGGLYALVTISDYNREKARTSIAAQSYAEQVKQPVEDLEYKPCGPVATYRTSIETAISDDVLPTDDYTATVDQVRYLQTDGTFGTGCTVGAVGTDGVARDRGLQQFWITINNGRAAPDDVEETLVIVKRDARCPLNQAAFTNPDQGPC